MALSRKAALRELVRHLSAVPEALSFAIPLPIGTLAVVIPAREQEKDAPADTHLTEAEEDVALILAAVPDNAGLQAKEVAARLKPKVDVDTVAMRLRRMRKRGLVEHVPGSGFRLIASLFAELRSTEQE